MELAGLKALIASGKAEQRLRTVAVRLCAQEEKEEEEKQPLGDV